MRKIEPNNISREGRQNSAIFLRLRQFLASAWQRLRQDDSFASPRILALIAIAFVSAFIILHSAFSYDSDNDGMDDGYELFYGLDPNSAADTLLNYDTDILNNLAESAILTDPFCEDTDRDGFTDGVDSNAISRAYIHWGDPKFTTGDNYDYAKPDWFLSAFKIDGDWITNTPVAWHVPASADVDVGSLNLTVDRDLLTNDAVLALSFFDHTNAVLYVDLVNSNYGVIATNLFGNLLAGSNQTRLVCLSLPLETYPEAALVHLRRESGEITMYEGLMYVDQDGDGLDEDQEKQLGTSDLDADSDDDGLGDYAEVFIHHTNPALADTDNDGLNDGAEVNTYHTDPLNPDADMDGRSDGWEVAHGYDPLSAPADQLRGLWRMDESAGAVAEDDSAYANHGAVAGALHVPGLIDNALAFNGSNSYVLVTNAAAYKPAHVSVVGYVKFTRLFGNVVSNYPDGTMPLILQKNPDNSLAYGIYKTSRQSLVFEVCNSSQTSAAAVTTADGFAVTGKWYQVAGTFDGTNIAFYVNGELIGAAAHAAPMEYDPDSGLMLGSSWPFGVGGYFAGLLDDIRIYSVALTSNQLVSLYQMGKDDDEDGLPNPDEIDGNTDPDNSDTDGDGMPDEWEVNHGLNPLVNDRDGDLDEDGLTNWEEYQLGTDPDNPDTDGDGMPDGWEASHGLDPLNPNDASLDADNDGLTNLQEYQLGTNPLNADTDGDGMLDGWEVAHGLNPLANDAGADPDNDGLTNLQEYQNGTDPHNWDSDGDGLSDGWEVQYNTNPISAPLEQMVGLWKLNETNDAIARDSSVYSNNGVIYSGVSVTGVIGNAIQFNGNDSAIVISNSSAYKPSQVSVLAYARFARLYGNTVSNAPDGFMTILGQKSAGNGYAYAFHKNERHALVFEIAGATQTNWLKTADGFAVTGRWYYLAGTFDGTNVAFYVNSELIGTSNHPAPLDYDVDVGLTLGQSSAASGEGGFLAGALDDVRIYNIVLTSNQVASLYIPGADADEDGLTTYDESQGNTDPEDTDTDNDGMDDEWEVSHGLNPSDPDDAGLDPDNDGLSNLQEYLNGTDPQNPDTDGDGLNDGAEVNTYYTDPTDADTDGDGLSDGVEVNTWNSNPLVVDTDGDGLADGQEVNVYDTDPTKPDTDGDGLTDCEEVAVYGTSPLLVDTDSNGTNDLAVAVAMTGTNTSYRYGQWAETNGLVYTLAPENARLEYAVNLTHPDIYRLGVQVTNCFESATTFHLAVILDGQPVGSLDIPVPLGTNAWGLMHTPWLSATNHTVRLAWLDSYTNKVLGVSAVKLEYVDGPDTNANGRQDWVDAILAQNPDTDLDQSRDTNEIAVGTAVLNPDTDGDGLYDAEEVSLFKTDPLQLDSDNNGTNDTELIQDLNGSDAVLHQTWTVNGDTLVNQNHHYVTCIAYYDLVAPTGGMYRLAVQGRNFDTDPPEDYRFQFFFTVNGRSISQTTAVYGDVDRSGRGYISTPWLGAGVHRIGVRWFNITPPNANLQLEKVQLYAVDAPDANTNGIQDWMETLLQQAGDTDGDGLSDYAEVMTYHTDPAKADTDGDGLTDYEEVMIYHTDPNKADTDGDGISDGDEVDNDTDPLTPDYDGTVTEVQVLDGSSTNSACGIWLELGPELRAMSRRGYVEYQMTAPSNDIYRLTVEATHFWDTETTCAVGPVDTSELEFYMDGQYIEKQKLVATNAEYKTVAVLTPWLTSGAHTVRIWWENVHALTYLQIRQLKLQSLGGADANTNGVKDWVETCLAAACGLDSASSNSVVSPVCLEGPARYVDLMSLSANGVTNPVNHGTCNRWYSDVALSPTGQTAVAISFQNGGRVITTNKVWVPLNLLAADDLSIRENDSLMLTAKPADATNGAVTIIIGGITNIVTTVDAPVIWQFTNAGAFAVAGIYDDGGAPISNSIMVTVVGAAFPTNSPACLIGRARPWDCPGIPSNVTVQADDSVTLTSSNSIFTIRMSKIIEDHYLVARLGAGGPILCNARLDGFWVQSTVDWYLWKALEFEDGSVLLVDNLVAKKLPPAVTIKLMSALGSIVFYDDMTLEKWLAPADLDEVGDYQIQLLAPASASGSACHFVYVYQDDLLLGEAYYSGYGLPQE